MVHKVLVTGSKGHVGTPFVRELMRRGNEVVEYDIKDGYDVNDYGMLVQEMGGCDTVVHLAAIPRPHPEKTPQDFWAQNCAAVHEVSFAALACGVSRLVFTSSTTYYGFEDGVPPFPPVDELSPHMSQMMKADQLKKVSLPAICYMQSKVVAENILAVYGLSKLMQVAILRLCPVRGTPYLGLYVYNENVTPALVKLVETERELWYEVFNFANPEVELVDTSKWDKFWGDEWQYC